MADDSSHPPADTAPDRAVTAPQAHAALTLVATPIGNLADISPRAIAALRAASLVLCEDTRITARLCAVHNISSRLMPFHDHNEAVATPDLIARMRRGERLALVSDAGTPLVSDPGYRLVRATIDADLILTAIPGANAAVTALQLSGLPPHPFLFLGFPPARQAARLAEFTRLRAAEVAGLHATLIWYEAPHRLAETLTDLVAVFGARPAAVARELTKTFEETRRAPLPDLAAHYATTAPRGEITLLVGPAPEVRPDSAAIDAALRTALAHMSLKDAASLVAEATGTPRKAVYNRALGMMRERAP